MESTAWGGLLLGNVWPAYLFALPLGARVWALWHAVPLDAWLAALHGGGSHPPADATPADLHSDARLLQELVTIAFLSLVVVLFAVRRRSPAGGRSTFWPGLVALLGTFLLNVVAYLPIEDSAPTGALLLSSGMIVLGTLFTIWSLARLGRCFGLLPEARGLVQQGPYSLVRHPVYLGELVSAVGLLIAKPHPLVLALFAAFLALQYARTVYEERALTAAFPADYATYRKRVPRLLPGLRP